jgi:hypothetical protein
VTHLDLGRIRIHEEADHYSFLVKLMDGLFVERGFGFDIQPAFGGEFFSFLRNQGDEVRSDIASDSNHFRGCCHFQVELGLDNLAKKKYVSS